MNVVGNRHVGNNVRILLINNGKGNEFRNYNHPCYFLGEEADRYVAAAGHYGNKSKCLVKNYAQNLGYEYRSASSKDEFNANVDWFVASKEYDRPLVFEVFTETDDESSALETVLNLVKDKKRVIKNGVKNAIAKMIGNKGVETIKKIIK